MFREWPKYFSDQKSQVALSLSRSQVRIPVGDAQRADLYKSIQTLKSIQIRFPNFELNWIFSQKWNPRVELNHLLVRDEWIESDLNHQLHKSISQRVTSLGNMEEKPWINSLLAGNSVRSLDRCSLGINNLLCCLLYGKIDVHSSQWKSK